MEPNRMTRTKPFSEDNFMQYGDNLPERSRRVFGYRRQGNTLLELLGLALLVSLLIAIGLPLFRMVANGPEPQAVSRVTPAEVSTSTRHTAPRIARCSQA